MWKLSLILIFCVKLIACAKLSVSNEDIVIEAIRENRNLVLLFSKKDCVDCRYEQSLIALQKELEETFDAKILKLENSHLQRLYDFNKDENALVFIRKGVPLLYSSTAKDNADEIFDFFSENREPIVKELDDSSFEHLTQASTGSTTGDWLIQFYDAQCVDCNRLTATWESVGAQLKRRMNVAKVNRATKGILTAKRFKVERVPEFIFLRAGKYYRYNLKQFNVESFVGFATTWYNKVTAEKIVAPATPFENLVDSVVMKLKELPDISTIFKESPVAAIAGASFAVLLILVFLLKKSKRPQETKKNEKDSVKKSSKKE